MKTSILYLSLIISLIGFNACKSSKNVTNDDKNSTTASTSDKANAALEMNEELPDGETTNPEDSNKPKAVKVNDEREDYIKKSKVQVKELVASFPDSLLTTWQRGSCYGRCPVYKVWVYKSGFVQYEGQHWTDRQGNFTTRFSSLELESIAEKAKEIDFFSLDIFYDSGVQDFPSTFYYVNNSSKRHGVRDMNDAPKKLKEFGTFLDSLLENKEYTKIKETVGE